jgi:hypothetical protein
MKAVVYTVLVSFTTDFTAKETGDVPIHIDPPVADSKEELEIVESLVREGNFTIIARTPEDWGETSGQ